MAPGEPAPASVAHTPDLHGQGDPTGRSVSPYTTREKVLRVLWMTFGQPLFSLTFHNWYGVRRWMLRCFGASVGDSVRIRPSVRVEQPWNLTIGANSSVGDRAILYCLGKVRIGRNTSLSQDVHLCAGTHDYTKRDLPLLRPPIVVGDEVWLAADVFVAPSTTIGDGTVVGARSSVFKSLPPWSVCAGSPARAIKPREFADHPGASGQQGGTDA